MTPRFSVIIATYNQKVYLLETIRSVMEQTLPALEIIVVSDGCTDGTADAVRNAYPAVKLIEQPNLGKCIARNTGIAAASGDWICILDHDDLWHRDKLAAVAGYITEHPDCTAITHPMWYFSETEDGPADSFGFQRDFVAPTLQECHAKAEGGTVSANDISKLNTYGNSFNLLLDRHIGPLSAVAIRKDILLRAGLFCPMQFNGEDWTLFVNVARLAEWHFIPCRLGFTRLNRGSGTYEIMGGMMLLSCQINAWFTGRPLRTHTSGLEFWNELDKHHIRLRREVQSYFWEAMLRGQFRLARLIRSAGNILLTRFTDRLYVLIPPPITWRIEHYIFHRHD